MKADCARYVPRGCCSLRSSSAKAQIARRIEVTDMIPDELVSAVIEVVEQNPWFVIAAFLTAFALALVDVIA